MLVNAIADEDPIEAGSKMHSVQMIQGRPVISRKVLYQPECRCNFTYANFPFDETDLVIKFSSNKWSAEQLTFSWSDRLMNADRRSAMKKSKSMLLKQGVDASAIGGLGQSEFEIVSVRVEVRIKCQCSSSTVIGLFTNYLAFSSNRPMRQMSTVCSAMITLKDHSLRHV